jgi:RNA-directed DNA polymerase
LQGKSYDIPKQLVWKAWLKVRSKGGAAGADGVTISQYEENVKNNLYKLWNRMSSGSYFPGPVRAVEIPKKGGTRVLGIPNVVDRIAQTVAVLVIEPNAEQVFHDDSYGYRPGRSPEDAVGMCRERCWKKDWVVDLDVKAFFDSVSWELMLKAVARHTDQKWVLLYVERWLKALMLMPDGSLVARVKGTPQGGPISPLIANIFLHYGFDSWMVREYPGVQFERFADDVVVHCVTERQARQVREAIGRRMVDIGLELHPDKTRIVYCKDVNRPADHPVTQFTFLGYTFRPRRALDKYGRLYVNFSPGVSREALTAMRQTVRSWHLQLMSDQELSDLSKLFGPVLRGWANYYGRFYPSALKPLWRHVNAYLVRWLRRKYQRLAPGVYRAVPALGRLATESPHAFVHWDLGFTPAAP